MIRNNAHKYSVSAMCEVLNIPRSTFYYEPVEKQVEDETVDAVKKVETIMELGRSRRNLKRSACVSLGDVLVEL